MIFDIIAGTGTDTGGIGSWTPAELFKSGEEGFWYDASDWNFMFQDGPATSPITAIGQTVGAWQNKIPGQRPQYFIGQGSALPRPTVASNGGKLVVRFDGVDDFLTASSSIIDIPNGFTIAIGQTKSSRQNLQAINVGGGFGVILSNVNDGRVQLTVGGETPLTSTAITSTTQPAVIVGSGHVGTPPKVLRVNGVSISGTAINLTQFTGSVTLMGDPTNACDLSQAVFINRVLTALEISNLEAYIGSKQ